MGFVNLQLTSLPHEVSAWTSLQRLDLGYNQLTSLPHEVSAWTSLQRLYLSYNQLTSLPHEVSAWTSLQRLYLSYNQLTSLPHEVSAWTSLNVLALYENPLAHPEVLRMSPRQVLSFYEKLEKSRRRVLRQRIMVMGDSEKGKTSLITRLISGKPVPRIPQDKRTFGIDIIPWSPSPALNIVRDNESFPIEIEFWDFAGQNLFYPTHRLFLETQAVYWIIFSWEDARDEPGRDRIISDIRDIFFMITSQSKSKSKSKNPSNMTTSTDSEQDMETVRSPDTDEDEREMATAAVPVVPEERQHPPEDYETTVVTSTVTTTADAENEHPSFLLIGTHADEIDKSRKKTEVGELDLIRDALCRRLENDRELRVIIETRTDADEGIKVDKNKVQVTSSRSSNESQSGIPNLMKQLQTMLDNHPHLGREYPSEYIDAEEEVLKLRKARSKSVSDPTPVCAGYENVPQISYRQLPIISVTDFAAKCCSAGASEEDAANILFFLNLRGTVLFRPHFEHVYLDPQWIVREFVSSVHHLPLQKMQKTGVFTEDTLMNHFGKVLPDHRKHVPRILELLELAFPVVPDENESAASPTWMIPFRLPFWSQEDGPFLPAQHVMKPYLLRVRHALYGFRPLLWNRWFKINPDPRQCCCRRDKLRLTLGQDTCYVSCESDCLKTTDSAEKEGDLYLTLHLSSQSEWFGELLVEKLTWFVSDRFPSLCVDVGTRTDNLDGEERIEWRHLQALRLGEPLLGDGRPPIPCSTIIPCPPRSPTLDSYLTMQKPYHVYVSHSGSPEDTALVYLLYRGLRNRGVRVMFDWEREEESFGRCAGIDHSLLSVIVLSSSYTENLYEVEVARCVASHRTCLIVPSRVTGGENTWLFARHESLRDSLLSSKVFGSNDQEYVDTISKEIEDIIVSVVHAEQGHGVGHVSRRSSQSREAERLEALVQQLPTVVPTKPVTSFETYEEGNDRSRELVSNIGIVLCVVVGVEFEAVLSHMKPPPERDLVTFITPQTDVYHIGIFGIHKVALVQQSDMGSGGVNGSHQVVTAAIDFFDPQAVIMIGIAFGLLPEKQKIGDVLVSQQLGLYDLQRVDTDVTRRGDIRSCGPTLRARFSEGATHTWAFLDSIIRRGLVLSGSVLVDSAEQASALLKEYKNAIGGEMEGDGVSSAADRKKKEWIVIKGICDFAGLRGEKDKKYQSLAAAAAASLVNHVLSVECLTGLNIHAVEQQGHTPVSPSDVQGESRID